MERRRPGSKAVGEILARGKLTTGEIVKLSTGIDSAQAPAAQAQVLKIFEKLEHCGEQDAVEARLWAAFAGVSGSA